MTEMRGWAGQILNSVSLNKVTEWPALASNVLSASLIGAYTAASLPSREHIIALVFSMLFVNTGQSLIFMMRPGNSAATINSQSFINSIPVGLLAVVGVAMVFVGCFTIQSLSRHDSRWLIVGLFVLMSLQFQFSEKPVLAVIFSAAVRACYFLLAGLVFSEGFPVLLAWIAGLIFTFHIASHFASLHKQSISLRKIWAIVLMLPLAAYATSGLQLFPRLLADETGQNAFISGIPEPEHSHAGTDIVFIWRTCQSNRDSALPCTTGRIKNRAGIINGRGQPAGRCSDHYGAYSPANVVYHTVFAGLLNYPWVTNTVLIC
jgi:hypothetical protein